MTTRPEASSRPSPDGKPAETPIAEMIQGLARTVGHPEFKNLIKEIEAKPEAERRGFAELVATPEEFAKRGIPVEQGFRVTTRYFEAPNASTINLEKISDRVVERTQASRGTLCASLGYIICVSYGEEILATL